MTLKTERELLKKEVTKLRRENTRLANANVNLNNTINANLKQAATHEALVERHGELQEELSSIKAAKNKLANQAGEDRALLQSSENLVEQLQAAMSKIQDEMSVVCEAVYGQHFDPRWTGDAPDTIDNSGITYARIYNTDMPASPTEYLEPVQRLLRMIWRRTHWALNPIPHHRRF